MNLNFDKDWLVISKLSIKYRKKTVQAFHIFHCHENTKILEMHRSTGQGPELADFPHDWPGPVTGQSVCRLRAGMF